MSISLSIQGQYFYKLLKNCSQMPYNQSSLFIIIRAGDIMKKLHLALLPTLLIAASACITVRISTVTLSYIFRETLTTTAK